MREDDIDLTACLSWYKELILFSRLEDGLRYTHPMKILFKIILLNP